MLPLIPFTNIDKLKSSVFDIAAMIYGLGLGIWSIHSYLNDLGIVSAIDTQYFIGGVAPFLSVWAIHWVFTTKFLFIRKISLLVRMARKNPNSKFVDRILQFYAGFIITAAVIILIFGDVRPDKFFAVGVLGASIVFLASFQLRRRLGQTLTPTQIQQNKKLVEKFVKRFATLTAWYLRSAAILTSIMFLFIYSLLLYPAIPQELGGGRPKTCSLEMKKGAFSNMTMKEIFNDTTGVILRSKPVEVYYYNSDKMIIAPSYGKVIEINRDDVLLIDWEVTDDLL